MISKPGYIVISRSAAEGYTGASLRSLEAAGLDKKPDYYWVDRMMWEGLVTARRILSLYWACLEQPVAVVGGAVILPAGQP